MELIVLSFALVSSVFVGFNIGGSSTGVAFGPAVGSGVLNGRIAAVLMSVFVFVGGATLGREVISTIGRGVVSADSFTLLSAVTVLSFVGGALLLSNLFGVPASASMTTVGATTGMGLALGTVQWRVLSEILMWWLISPVIAFWLCAVIGRYLYDGIASRLVTDHGSGPVLKWRTVGLVSVPIGVHRETRTKTLVTRGLVAAVGCYMAFTAGASNVANTVGPLFGAGLLGGSFDPYVLLGGAAITLGAFSIARRTIETVGNQLTSLSTPAAVIVELVGATLVSFLSWLGIPVSLAVSTTMCVIGLGWGRASRAVSLRETVSPPPTSTPHATRSEISTMYDGGTTGRVIALWLLVPSIAAFGSYVVFEFFIRV